MSLDINGEIIDDEVIEKEFQYHSQFHQTSSREDLLQTVKEEIVLKTLLRQEVEKFNFSIPEEMLEQEIKSFQQWNKRAREMPVRELRPYVFYKIKEEKFIETIVVDLIQPKRSHLEQFYQDNQKDYLMGKKYRLIEISSLYVKAIDEVKKKIEKLKNIKIEEMIQDNRLKLREWLGYQEELTEAGIKLLSVLELSEVSMVLDYPVVIFKPFSWSKKNVGNGTYHLNHTDKVSTDQEKNFFCYFLLEKVENFLPPFEEIEDWVREDLLDEMRKIKVNLHLRKLMQTSKIVDNIYLD